MNWRKEEEAISTKLTCPTNTHTSLLILSIFTWLAVTLVLRIRWMRLIYRPRFSSELSLDVVHESRCKLFHVVLFHVWNAYVNQRVSRMQRSPHKIYQKYNTSFTFSHFFCSIVSHVRTVSLVKHSCLLPRRRLNNVVSVDFWNMAMCACERFKRWLCMSPDIVLITTALDR